MEIFWNYTISTVSEGVKTWGKACLLTLYFEWWAKRSVRERARPSLSFRVLLAFAFHDICLREFAHRLWWDAPVCSANRSILVSRISKSMYYKDMWSYLIIWTLPPSSDHKPAKKGFHCHLKVSQHFRGRKTLPIYLKQSLLLLFENTIILFILTSPCWLMIGAAYSWLTSCNRHSRKRLATPISVWHSTSKNKSRFSSYGTITKFIQFSCVWNMYCGLIAFWYEFHFIWYPYHLLITHITIAKKQSK